MQSLSLAQRAAFLIACFALELNALVLRDHIHRGVAGFGRAESCSTLTNRGTHFTIGVGVGTPPQNFDLIADTGSNALTVLSCVCKQNIGKYYEECTETEKCFDGANDKSSTFVAPGQFDNLVMTSYAAGDLISRPATDVVHVGQVSTTMEKGVLLIVKRMFRTTYDFEGILGLGVPSWADSRQNGATATSAPTLADGEFETGDRVLAPNYLEVAKINMFSLCFNPGENGALRLDPPAMPKMLQQIGKKHWSLGLTGFSAGFSKSVTGAPSSPMSVCNGSSETGKAGELSPCAAIPDSGSTFIMGPKDDVERVLAGVCTQWPRCEEFRVKNQITDGSSFRKVLWDCHGWITQDQGISEIPSIFVHVRGSDGATDVLEISPMSYVHETSSAAGHAVCAPSFGEFDMQTAKHGPAWILGTPLFYGHQVGYGLRPPSIGFSTSPCTLCDDETTSLMLTNGSSRAKQHTPQVLVGKPRPTSINAKDEL